MSKKTLNIHPANIAFLLPITPTVRRARILLARARKLLPELRPTHKVKKPFKALDDPLLRVEEYRYDGPIAATANEDIDRTICSID